MTRLLIWARFRRWRFLGASGGKVSCSRSRRRPPLPSARNSRPSARPRRPPRCREIGRSLRVAAIARLHRNGEAGVEVRPGLEEALRVAGADAVVRCGLGGEIARARGTRASSSCTSNDNWFGRSSHHSAGFEPTIRTFCPCIAPAFTSEHQTVPKVPLLYSISVTALSSSGARLRTKLWRAQRSRLILSCGAITSAM